jgi:uncharacterized membrane protein YfcA
MKVVQARRHEEAFGVVPWTAANAVPRVHRRLINQHTEMTTLWPAIALATLGVTSGTVLGSRALARIPEVWFRRVLALVLATLGAAMLWRGV